jgi:AraC-like DNA-binding protein
MDVLSEFFDRIQMKGRLFYAGRVYTTLDINKPEGTALIHIVENGGVSLIRPGHPRLALNGMTVLLCPSTCRYKLQPDEDTGVGIICATFEFGSAMGQLFPLGLTDTLVFPFQDCDQLMPVIQTLLGEYRSHEAGHHKSLSILFEYVLIVLVRRAISEGRIERGSLSAILHPQLGNAITAIHRRPEQDWSVEQLAHIACMSRTKFSAQFLKIVGMPPIAYLSAWRMKFARDLMVQGVQLKIVASSVGYSSQAALSRAFVQDTGLPPGEWLKRQGR